ncbi:anti-phage defense-associated sirtuin Dsr1 [Pectobacterium brasiliense]|uniref:anti-phage defense-associated sirtuin Dsr1 n=1 Tax=Pectobacterium brasiliense TaxID=180957 RepID=UPI001968A935|nr:anti-phage defense-associated sirtuin Dsr1 [Pectobacterium brasiliense]MBN3228182.1 SIR2 family protein [Pectobacterium brasiliense]
MQFVTNGPDIPDSLLQAHEEGRVVFFCGAGVSVPAKLPDFKQLVENIFKQTDPRKTPQEEATFSDCKYDSTLNLLEHRFPLGRMAVRRALVSALTRRSFPQSATETHSALLRLSKTHDDRMRLVTTNFDSLFELAGKRDRYKFPVFSAPMLPVPKNSRWNGLVYLHGAISRKMDETALNRLVVTSGDFGQAYLTERWAARFVSELFRNYVVCFVGYGINDPVLRYMMDALAADKLQGETTQPAWAFASFVSGQKDDKRTEWLAKGVTPVLYEAKLLKDEKQDHSLLHKTLIAWANTYRDGVTGKESIVLKYASSYPSKSTVQDDFVGRMLWALSDKSGLPARRLAEHKPAPPLEWYFKGLNENRFSQSDLKRFGVTPRENGDEKLDFSLICRPSPYHLSPFMMLFAGDHFYTQWDEMMINLARWLLRYLDDPKLLISFAKGGTQLHPRFRNMISEKIASYAKLENEGKTSELNEIRQHSPSAIPGPQMKKLWQLFLSRRVELSFANGGIIPWKQQLGAGPLTATLRFELRELLAPRIRLSEPYDLPSLSVEEAENDQIGMKQLAQWDLVLSTPHARSLLNADNDERLRQALPALFDDLQILLRDALDLMKMMSDGDEVPDYSQLIQPSIQAHSQNRGHRDWTLLIELLRDAWLGLLGTKTLHATQAAIGWFQLPYTLFKRLALFAASKDENITGEQWVSWLTDNEAHWLWSVETSREVFRLLVLRGKDLAPDEQHQLESAILAGPPFTDNGYYETDEQAQWHQCKRIWLALAKLQSSGLALGEDASVRLHTISSMFPNLKLASNQRDEFSFWMGSSGDSELEARFNSNPAPETWQALIEWLREDPEKQWVLGDDGWRDVCTDYFDESLKALLYLSESGIWPEQRWKEALQAWSRDEMPTKTWNAVAPLIHAMPNNTLQALAHTLGWWIERCSKILASHDDIFKSLCKRLLAIPLKADSDTLVNGEPIDNPVSEAINHPIGYVTQALFNYLFSNDMQDDDLLPSWLEPYFTALCDVKIRRFRHGRVILASNLIPLLRIDPVWTKAHLLPFFNWDNPSEARVVWSGFLWSPRLYQPLFDIFKQDFLRTVNHLDLLGEYNNQYISVLTYTALDMAESFTDVEFREAFNTLTNEGLETVLQALTQALEAAGDQREAYWANRITPFWNSLWPKSIERITPRISELLVQLILSAGDAFPAGYKLISAWIIPVEFLHYLIHLFLNSGMCNKYPKESLDILSALIVDQPLLPDEISICLEQIFMGDPTLEKSQHAERLKTYLRRKNG